MAEHLASIFGTEKDRVNCPFYFKIGACRHGDRCSRIHNRPTISPTLLMQNMYQNPALNAPMGPDGLPVPVDPRASQEHFEDFYEDVFEELDKFGEIENLNVCDNLADHMVGSVYVKFKDENDAAKAMQGLMGRYYHGRPIICEFSPVTDFREATCRQYEENTCTRGGYCNFMHLRPISRDLRKHLFGRYKKRENSRSKSPDNNLKLESGLCRVDSSHSSSRCGTRFASIQCPRCRKRGRSPRRGHDDRRGRDRERGYDRNARENSAERRAKIASWQAEKDAADRR